MKKILFVHYSLVCGGVETALLNLCTMLNKSKYDITVLEYEGWDNKLKPQFVDAGIKVITPYSELVPGKNCIQKIRNVYKQRKIELNMQKNNVFINDKFDLIVYFQVTKMKVRCLSKPKVITYIHGDVKTNKLYCKNIIEAIDFVKSADLVVCVSELAKKSLEEVIGTMNNAIVAYNPIDNKRIYEMSKMKIEKLERPYICAVGRIAIEKRFDLLIRIHKNILTKGIAHDLVIVGDGRLKSELEAIVHETNTENSVHLVGFKENPYPYIKNSLFTVCSSDTEGLHLVSMESLVLCKPVVSSFPTIGELFGDIECGVLTDVDGESLEDGIYRMLKDKKLYNKCVAGAKKRSDYFDADRMMQRIEKLYDEVML